MRRFRKLSSADGFTLIETMAALTVFTIMVLGIAPLLASTLRGSALSRSYNVGKDIGQAAMERVRGLPYFDAAPKRDVIDLYFPDLVVGTGGSGYNTTTKTFTTICTATSALPAASGALSCPPKRTDGTSPLPTGYSMTFLAQFVSPVANSNPETYNVITPPVGWTAASTTAPSQMLRVTMRVTWQQGSKSANFQLISLVGDRKLTPEKLRANATVDFLAQALTSYRVPTGPEAGRLSTLRAFTGRSISTVALKNFASADQDSRAVQMTLAGQEFGGQPGSVIQDETGAAAIFNAPPSATVTVSPTAASKTINAPPGVTVAGGIGGFTGTDVNENLSPAPAALVTNELPRAAGNFGYPGGSTEEFWVTNQADTGNSALLALVPGAHVLSVQQPSGGGQSKRIFGSTYAETFPVSPTALRLRSTAKAQAETIALLPTGHNANKPLITLTDFVASADCQVSGTTSTTIGSWSGILKYKTASGLITKNLGGSTTPGAFADDLLPGPGASNPLVAGVAGTATAVYLFDEPGKPGFLDSWSYTPLMTSSKPDARSAKVSMPYAMNIVTAKTDPANPESKLSVAIGGMSCEAVDKRA
jgi:prepilin-type N-terminal cleavage/methylation domain-containing protein